MIKIDYALQPEDLKKELSDLFEVAAKSTKILQKTWDTAKGTPVFTIDGQYTSRGWTEWTQGFQFGDSILLYDATSEKDFLEYGRREIVGKMATHLSHTGVHDHGFNNISSYGNLLRLMTEGRIQENEWERNFYELALKVSGAVQASRWTDLPDDNGYVYSFNGPHSLFCDTIRSMRALAASHMLGYVLMGEQDAKISLLKRLLQHAETTARYNVYFGEHRDSFDVRGRTAHESIFNVKSGAYRCPSSQQGYSPFSTWTRGLAWVLSGYPEQLEYLETRTEEEIGAQNFKHLPDKKSVQARFLATAEAVADFYIDNTPTDGIPYWDTGAPGLVHLPGYLDKPADPFNAYEPVDSSAAAICAQGLLRLGHYLKKRGGAEEKAKKYFQAGLTLSRSLFSDPYLARSPQHQGILLHSVYHQPNGWDQIHAGQQVPNGESCFWGDYHALELGVYIQRLAEKKPYYSFFNLRRS